MHDSKICFKCEKEKPLTEFYKHKGMFDGYLGKCKECAKKDTKENREKNADYYREYDANRFQKDARVKARHERYQKSEAGKEAGSKAKRKYIEANIVKRSAHVILGNALRDGRIVKPDSCQNCGAGLGRIHAHHDDYAYPMVVRWLCPKCHKDWHKENGPGMNV
jgi:ribosomal protein S27AE